MSMKDKSLDKEQNNKNSEESLKEQRELLRLQLQCNRLQFLDRMLVSKQEFPRSLTMRFLNQFSTQDILTTLTFSTVGARLFPSLVRGVYVAKLLHQFFVSANPAPPRVERLDAPTSKRTQSD